MKIHGHSLNHIVSGIFESKDTLVCKTAPLFITPTKTTVSYTYEFTVSAEGRALTPVVKSFKRFEKSKLPSIVPDINSEFKSIDTDGVLPIFFAARILSEKDICQSLVDQAISYPGFQALLGQKTELNASFMAEIVMKLQFEVLGLAI
jgi:hypothetical protein